MCSIQGEQDLEHTHYAAETTPGGIRNIRPFDALLGNAKGKIDLPGKFLDERFLQGNRIGIDFLL